FPQLNPYTFYDVSDGPTSAHIYHSVWSAARALTYLESRTLASSIIVGGASMGGMETVILSAIDDRVDGSLSMISGGNLFESLMEGSLINSLINPDYDIGSEELDLLQRWFDPIAYYRQLTKPLFMIFGTNDPFFPVSGFMQTIDEISAPLTLSIRPNYGHVVDTSWSEVIVRWMNAEFRATPSYPIILNVTSTELLTVAGLTLQVRVASTSLSDFYICWRTGNPGATWTITPMTLVDDEYVVDLTPLLVGKVTYFVYSAEESTVLMSSELLIGNSGSFGLFVLAILSAIAIFFLSQMTGWKITQSNLIRQLPIGVGIVMIGLGMILPFYGIEGRVEISLLSFIEVHGQALGLSGWFLTLALFILYYIVALAAVRHQLEFRVVVAVWFPMLVLVTIAHIFFAGVFAISGGLNYVYTGFGAFLMIFAVPVMLIMESFFKDTTAEEKLIAKVLENQTV
ncbi:MAG: alpha/beta hydrolase family protein, partial [Candidatus Thorarchaeota archaeon]